MNFQADVDAIQRIGAGPQIPEVICRTTGRRPRVVAEDDEELFAAGNPLHFHQAAVLSD